MGATKQVASTGALARARFEQGDFEEAARLYEDLLVANETAEAWNDWAAAQLACGRTGKSEDGFRRALQLDPTNAQAMANLGVLLVSVNRKGEAIQYLRAAITGLDDAEAQQVQNLIIQCGEPIAAKTAAASGT